MKKIHNIAIVILGVAFWLALQNVSADGIPISRVVFTLGGYGVVLGLYNFWYLKKTGKYSFWTFVRPLLWFFTGVLVFFFIPSPSLRSVFIALLSVLLALDELFLGSYAENALLNETLVLSFFSSFSFMALQEVFPERLLWGVGGFFFSSFLITRAFFEFIPKPPAVKTLASVVLAFFSCQVYWAMSFLPHHYSALGFLLFNVYYFFMILTYYSFFLTLNAKKIYFHLTLMAVSSGLVLLATPWKIIK